LDSQVASATTLAASSSAASFAANLQMATQGLHPFQEPPHGV
jgi:hypothetical protein